MHIHIGTIHIHIHKNGIFILNGTIASNILDVYSFVVHFFHCCFVIHSKYFLGFNGQTSWHAVPWCKVRTLNEDDIWLGSCSYPIHWSREGREGKIKIFDPKRQFFIISYINKCGSEIRKATRRLPVGFVYIPIYRSSLLRNHTSSLNILCFRKTHYSASLRSHYSFWGKGLYQA